jgi:hypothetical protein
MEFYGDFLLKVNFYFMKILIKWVLLFTPDRRKSRKINCGVLIFGIFPMWKRAG